MDFLAVSRCVCAGSRLFLSWFNHLQLPAPLVEAPRSYPEFSRQLTDIFASLQPCNSHSLKFPGVSLSLHWCFLSRKLCPILRATSRVHSKKSHDAGIVSSTPSSFQFRRDPGCAFGCLGKSLS